MSQHPAEHNYLAQKVGRRGQKIGRRRVVGYRGRHQEISVRSVNDPWGPLVLASESMAP